MYKQSSFNVVLRVLDYTYIPFDPANTDYQEYLKWLAEGNEPLPADEPVAEEPAPVVEPTPVIEEPVVAEPAVDEAPPTEEPSEG